MQESIKKAMCHIKVTPVLFSCGRVVLTLFLLSLLTYACLYLTPYDPAELLLYSQGIIPTPELLENLREQMNIQGSFFTQYLSWLTRFVQGDLGLSLVTGRPFAHEFAMRIPRTLVISIASLGLGITIALIIGAFAACAQNTFIDRAICVLSYLFSSVPLFLVALIILTVFAVEFKWFDVTATQARPRDYVMPIIALTINVAAWYIRHIRSLVLIELKAERYVTFASRGLSIPAIVLRHVYRHISIPLISLAATSFGTLLAGSVLVEQIFSFNGMGAYGLQAILAKDYPVIQAYVLYSAVIFLLVHTLADLLIVAIDPRLSFKFQIISAIRQGILRVRDRVTTGFESELEIQDNCHIINSKENYLRCKGQPVFSTRMRYKAPLCFAWLAQDVTADQISQSRRKNKYVAWGFLALLGIVCLIALFAHQIAPFDPFETNPLRVFVPPSAEHILGTDTSGRDIFSRVLAGLQSSLFIALVVVIISLVLGTAVGSIAALSGGVVDRVCTHIIAVFQAFPDLILALVLVTIFSQSTIGIICALVPLYWTRIARYARGLVLAALQEQYLMVSRLDGAPWWWIYLRHILPNIAGSLLVLAMSEIGMVVLSLSSLAFVGLGLSAPALEWGTLISENRVALTLAPWAVLGPGVALTFLCLLSSLLADAWQNAWLVKGRS